MAKHHPVDHVSMLANAAARMTNVRCAAVVLLGTNPETGEDTIYIDHSKSNKTTGIELMGTVDRLRLDVSDWMQGRGQYAEQ